MGTLGIWLTPLLLLPGVGMMIMSTSMRFGQLHQEIHHQLSHGFKPQEKAILCLLKRAKLFRNSLLCLYICVATFSLAALIGGITAAWELNAFAITMFFTGIGICLL